MLQHILGSLFWQSVAGNLFVNTLSALGIGAALMAFFRYVLGIAWKRRQTLIGWGALVLTILLILEAIRYNTVSARESTIVSLQASVETLNRRLTPRHLTETQTKDFVSALSELPAASASIDVYFNIGDYEAYQYEVSLVSALNAAHWHVTPKGGTGWQLPGLFIVKDPYIPPLAERDAKNLAKAFQQSGIQFTQMWSPFEPARRWVLIVGPKPPD